MMKNRLILLQKITLSLVLLTAAALTVSAQNLNDNGGIYTIHIDNCCTGEYYEVSQGNAQDYIIPADAAQNAISFVLRGGDGGFAKAGADCKRWGGDGATVKAVFLIGNEAGQLEPGGKIRFVVGKHGEDIDRGGTASGGSGGGGGTGVLYQPNNSSDWIILAVAGGGGGAHQGNLFGGCLDSQNGQGGRASENGGDGEGDDSGSGGTGGNGGNSGPAGTYNDSGAGGGANTAGSGGSISGDAGYSGGGYGGDTDPNSSYDLLGRGGFGFGGGGEGGAATPGGGGGGYSGGGGGGKVNNGGGGGSYVNGTYAYIQNKADGGTNSGTDHGYATYQFLNMCTPEIDWIEEVDGFCGSLLGGAHLQVHLNNASNCTGTIKYQLFNPLINITNTSGQFTLMVPGTYTLAIRVEWNGYNGIVDTETITVTQGDTRPPIARCKNYTLSLSGSSRLITNFENLLDNGSTDNCGIASYAVSSNFFDCSDLGANNITLTVTDGAGNSSTCVSVVTVVDTGAPVPDVTNLPAITEDCSVNITTIPTATDACDGTITGTTNNPLSYTEPGTYTVTWTYTDSKGNTRTQNQTVILNDASAPAVSCPNDITVNASAGACTAKVNFMATASDNCDMQPDQVSYLAYSQNVPAGNDRLLIVQVAHFEHVTGITYNGLAMTKILHQDANVAGTLDLWYIPLGSGGAINAVAEVSGVGSNKRVEHISFENVDQDNPIADIDQVKHQNTVRVNTRVMDMIYEGFMRKDGGLTLPQSGQTLIFDRLFNSNSTTSWGSYKMGNGSAQNLSINSSNGAHAAVVIQAKHQTAIAYSIDPGSEFQVGTTPVTFTATDHANNSSSCTYNVTVQTTTPPSVTCPNNMTVNNDADACGAVITYNVLSSDNCSTTTLAQTAGLSSSSSFPVGTTTNTFVATNGAGISSTCSFNVTVNDHAAPEAICQDVTLTLDDNGEATLSAAEVDNGSSDNCNFTMAIDQTEFSCTQLGTNTVTLTATDEYGNPSSCTSTVTVIDNLAPTAICHGEAQSDQRQLISNQSQGFSIGAIGQSFTAGLDGYLSKMRFPLTTSINNNNIIIAPTVEIRAGEGLNGTLLSIAPIPVSSTESTPIQWIEVAFPAPVYVNAGTRYTFILRSNPSGQDNITTFDLSLNARRGSNNPYPDGFMIYGNGAPETAIDLAFETFVIPALHVTVQLDADGNGQLPASDIDDGSFDNCSGDLSFALSSYEFSCADVGSPIAVTMTVTDESGNSASCSTPVFVMESTAIYYSDQDGDGYTSGATETGCFPPAGYFPASDLVNITELDCNDNDDSEFPGQVWYRDFDNDGYTNNSTLVSCERPTGYKPAVELVNTADLDCDDMNGAIHPGAAESCNGIDDNCNGQTDEGVQSTFYADSDGDGYGDPAVFVMDCSAPDGYVADNTDCDDTDGDEYPGQGWYPDSDNDGYRGGAALIGCERPDGYKTADELINTTDIDCNDGDPNVFMNQTWFEDMDDDGYYSGNLLISCNRPAGFKLASELVNTTDIDCNDDPATGGTINPGAAEICDGIDNDCDGFLDSEDPDFVDNTQPDLSCPAGIEVAMDAGQCGAIVSWSAPTATDNCDDSFTATQTMGALSGSFFAEGIYTIEYTATDAAGNSRSCSFTVTVLPDAEPPVPVCMTNTTVMLDVNGNYAIQETDVFNGGADNCGTVNFVSLSPATVGVGDVGTPVSVTVTVNDGNGNTSTCTAAVIAEDNIGPIALCRDVTVQLDAAGTASTSATAVDNGSNDASGIQAAVLSQQSFSCTDVGANPVTLTVTDNNGNTSTCTATVTVEDNVAPTALCRNLTVQLDANGNGSTSEVSVDNGSNDACGIASLSLGQTAFECGDVGANAVTLTATDVNGNTSTCTATVTVEDHVAPVALCQNVTVQLDANGSGSPSAGAVDNGSNDACGIQSAVLSSQSFSCANVGANTVTLTVTDNNDNISTCSATVTVEDNVAPTALCRNVTVQLDANGNGSTSAAAVDNGSNDACGIASISLDQTAFDCGDAGSNTVTLTVTDVNNNVSTCSATVSVEDHVNPIALCNNITVLLDMDGQGEITATQVDNGSNDACGIQTLALNQTKFNCDHVGTVAVTLVATDVNGNQGSCPATITVLDPVAPEALCQDVTVQLDASGNGSTSATAVDNGSNDACGIQSAVLSQQSFSCAEVGENTVTLTVTDVNGNASICSATVTVEDNVAPDAVCQNVTVQLDENGEASTTATAVDNGSSDACGVQSAVLSRQSFSCAETGANTVTLTVTDVNGNASTCTATVTVEDDIDPEVDCSDITVTFNGESSIALDPDAMATATDNCTVAGFETDLPFISCDALGEIVPVTVTARDLSGNMASCTSNVTVEGLPCGWMSTPDGIGCTNGNNGDYDPDSETFTLMASGCYTPSATYDESGYIMHQLCGDGSITAHIAGLTLPGFAGIVMRESDAPGAKKVAMAYQGTNAVARYVRYTNNGASFPSYINTPGSRWLRIVRTGNTFRGYHSVNGITWVYAFAVTVPMNSCIQVGLIAWGTNPNSVVTATFDHVVIDPPYGDGLPRELIHTDGTVPVKAETEGPDMELWPNPSSGQFNLSLDPAWGGKVTVSIEDVAGRVVAVRTADATVESRLQLDLGNEPPGIYLVRVENEDGAFAIRRMVRLF